MRPGEVWQTKPECGPTAYCTIVTVEPDEHGRIRVAVRGKHVGTTVAYIEKYWEPAPEGTDPSTGWPSNRESA